jgi:hypothetical protein
MRREAMREDAKQQRMNRIIADFWEAVWRAKPRILEAADLPAPPAASGLLGEKLLS